MGFGFLLVFLIATTPAATQGSGSNPLELFPEPVQQRPHLGLTLATDRSP